jgi:hypothetical protein
MLQPLDVHSTLTVSMDDGPALPNSLRRLWPMLVCALLGTLPVAGILAAANVRLTTALLGIALTSYASIGLSGVHFKVPRRARARSTDRSRHWPHQWRDRNFRRSRRAVSAGTRSRERRIAASACNLCRSYQRLRWHWDSASIRGLGSPLSSRQRSRWWRRSSAWRSVRCCDLGCQSQPSDIGFSLACWRWAAACSRGSFSNTPFPASSCSLMVERETAPRRCCKPSW